ncbi:MAG: HAMP domain-containing protein [Deltaproteobacteria bacterium]|nr:HAMP domain-containing protein [Deltaproteobacteria bacterium]
MSALIRKMEAGRNLGHLFMIAFFSSSIVVLLVSSSLQLTAYFRSEKRVLYNNQQVIAEGASSAVVGFIQEKCQELATAAWLTDPETTSREEWLLVLQSLLGLQPSFRRLAVRDERFQIVAAASRYAPPGLGHPEDLQEAARFSKPHDAVSCPEISDVYMDPVTSEPLVSIRVPVVNALREFKNTLTAELNLKFMWDLVDQLKVGKTGYAYVVNHQGQVIAFGDTARVLKGENVAHLPPVREFLQDPNAQRSQRAQLYRGIAGGLVVGTYVPLRTPNWAIVTELPWMEAFREVIEATGISLAIIVLMAFLAALLGLGISRRLTVPLVTLKETAMRIAGGERELQIEVDGPEELAQLAAAFNSMSSQLQRSLKELEGQFEEIKSARVHSERARNDCAWPRRGAATPFGTGTCWNKRPISAPHGTRCSVTNRTRFLTKPGFR